MSTSEPLSRRQLAARVDELLTFEGGMVRPRALAICDDVFAQPEDEQRRLVGEVFSRLLSQLYDEAGPLGRDRHAPPERLVAWLEIVELFRDRLLPAVGEEVPDALDEVRREARWLLEVLRPEDEVAHRVGRQLTADIDRLTLKRASDLETDRRSSNRPGRPLQIIGEHLSEYLARGRRTFVGTLDQHRREVWRGILREYREREGAERRAYVLRLAEDIRDRGEDALARVEDVPRLVGDRLLSNALTDVRRTRLLLRKEELHREARPLARLGARIDGQRSDRRVRSRRLAQVGPRALAWCDRAMLGVILLVVAVLFLRLFVFGENEETWLRWVDAGASSILLLDFLWRFQASGWRLRYLGRHVFTDVLPSLLVLAVLQTGPVQGKSVGAILALRLARPLIELYRILAFTSRGVDRLVHENRALLNRNVILFEPVPEQEEEGRQIDTSLEQLHARLARVLRLELRHLGLEDEGPGATEIVTQRLVALGARLEETGGGHDDRSISGPRGREIRIEVLIEGLLTLEADVVEDYLGRESADRLARFLGFLDVPLVRDLPFLRRVVPGIRRVDPLDGLALAGRGLGRALDEAMDHVRLYDDFRGIVTGPQIVDRVGAGIVKATQRPAVRLMIFGIGTLVIGQLVGLVPSLSGLHDFLFKVLSAMVWLGSICLIFWALGQWLRRIADEATELCQRVAEAQGINLLKLEKREQGARDRGILWERALGAEARRLQPDEDAFGPAWVSGSREERSAALASRPRLAGLAEQADFLYADYLDGGVLHRSNVKSTEQAMGNLDLKAIREQRLKMTRKERKRLDKLALDRTSALPTGPSLWFRFITESLAQGCARLILDYDRHLVPLAHRHRIDPAALEAQARWIHREPPPPSGKRKRRETELEDLGQGCARFHALHFLSRDEERDARVAAEFGEEVLARLAEDRRRLVRDVFATRGWERLSAAQRMGNPLVLYGRFVEGGRFLFLPLRVLFGSFRLATLAIRRIVGVVRELLQSHGGVLPDREEPFVTEAGVVRKINRMHRPIFMEMLELRARFDPEFLGATIPGQPETRAAFGDVQDDLTFVGSREYEKESFREMASDREHAMRSLDEQLAAIGWPEDPLALALHAASSSEPCAIDREAAIEGDAEAVRAVSIAWAADHEDARTLLEAQARVRAIFTRIIELADADTPMRRFLYSPFLGRRFRAALEAAGLSGAPLRHRRLLKAAFARNRQGVSEQVKQVMKAGGFEAARSVALASLARVAAYPAPWTHQLLTVRIVQTMTRLDIMNSRQHVLDLAELDAEERVAGSGSSVQPAEA